MSPAAERAARNRRIVALAMIGTPPHEIASLVDCSSDAVSHQLAAARRRDAGVPRFSPGPRPVPLPASAPARPSSCVAVPPDVLAELAGPAARRGMTAHGLVRHLLTVIVDEEMLEAILDDGADARARAHA